jgi:hypothetical protein
MILQIQAANEKELKERYDAFEDLNKDLSTAELKRLVELKNIPKARLSIKTAFNFTMLKGRLSKF